jgi:hypothetical protein
VQPGCTESQLRTAYRQAALSAHPDKPGGSIDRFHLIAFAFEVLSCAKSQQVLRCCSAKVASSTRANAAACRHASHARQRRTGARITTPRGSKERIPSKPEVAHGCAARRGPRQTVNTHNEQAFNASSPTAPMVTNHGVAGCTHG